MRHFLKPIGAALLSVVALVQPAFAATDRVTIAVIDTGISQIPLLDGKLERARVLGEHPAGLVSSHGTIVASLIALKAKKPFAIIPYQVEGLCVLDQCQMPFDRIAAAVRDAVQQGASIIQISSEGKFVGPAREALIAAARSGVHVVVAAGNKPRVTFYQDLIYEAGPNFHVIGSLDPQNGKAPTSAFGSGLKWRQGVALAAVDQHNRAVVANGTSFAASLYTADLVNGMELGEHTEIALATVGSK